MYLGISRLVLLLLFQQTLRRNKHPPVALGWSEDNQGRFSRGWKLNSAKKQMEKSASQVARGSTTFIHTDKTSFRELVQRLTGSPTDCDRKISTAPPTNDGATVKVTGIKRPTSKLHERRQYTRSKLEIVKPGLSVLETTQTGFHFTDRVISPSQSGNLAFNTSPLGTPSKALLNLSISGEEDEEDEEEAKSVLSDLHKENEEKAIKERRFYLHPSPSSKPGKVEPELLPLFPLTSPKAAYQS
ncbi:hypothetical protein NE237_030109 [Protea cynaroides]|uniref:VQ domain-containing protein n=1 Tax=Protea cynaroides TaxID=273540 RepID=A0A9Q0GWJ4_9MAGN|nr:hypothetical protein NE237_030109 [Protea cynaroides]